MPEPTAPHVARYRLAERLGAGGLGVVLAAYDPQLGRRVAIKLIRTGTTDARAFARLEREAAALARVSHPHVVGVFDVGRYDARGAADGDGLEGAVAWPHDVPRSGVYIVMELCEGTDLVTWLAQPRTPQEILRVFHDAGRGLAAAHAAGVVHRDFKPANVVVDGRGRVKVIDFGLAQWLHGFEPSTQQEGVEEGGASEVPVSMTMTGTVMGTPAYMAPEQHAGAKLGPRSDQYAFCVALVEALCGARPFAGDTVAELHQAKRALRFDPRARELPPRLRAVLERGLASDPDARWPDMDALLRALEPPRSFAAWWGGGLLVGAVGLASWVAAGSGPAGAPAAAPAPPAPVAAVVPPDGYLPSYEAQALREAAEIAAVGPRAVATLEALVERVDRGSSEPDDPSLEAELLLWRGRASDDAVAVDLYRRAFFLAREVDVPSIAARAAIAMTTAAVDDHGPALDEWTRHAWVEVERGPEDRSAAIEVAVTAAYGRSIAISDDTSAELLALASAVVGDLAPDDGVYVAHQLLQLAAAWRAMDQPGTALWWARRAKVLLDAVAPSDHPLHANAAEEIARGLYWHDRCLEAMPYFDEALARYRAQGGLAAEEEASCRDLVATCLHELGRVSEAIAEQRLALAYWEAERPEITVPRLRSHLEVARMLVELDRRAEAEQEYQQVLDVVDPTAPDHWMRQRAREELAALRSRP